MKQHYKKKEKKINKILLKNLIQSKNHYGSSLKDLNPNSIKYLYGIRNKQPIINLNYTIQTLNRSFLCLKKLKKSFLYVKKVKKKKIKTWNHFKNKKHQVKNSIKIEKNYILIIANDLKLKLLKDCFLEQFTKHKIKYISEDWLGGFITNSFLLKNQLKDIRLIISFNEIRKNILINEARKAKIPLISVVGTNTNFNLINYPIVTNCNNVTSIFFLMFLFKKYLNNLKK